MIIDATDSICGRLATVAAKKALLGERVEIVNCEKAVISGNKRLLIAEWKHKNTRGVPKKGPFIYKTADRFVKRIVRGMLGHRTGKGSEAFERVKCYVGVPEDLKSKDFV